jgi:hypothetical protein
VLRVAVLIFLLSIDAGKLRETWVESRWVQVFFFCGAGAFFRGGLEIGRVFWMVFCGDVVVI